MALVTTIPSISFSRNFPVLTVEAEGVTAIVLKKAAEVVLNELYYPDDTGIFTIDLADLLTSLLTIEIPTTTLQEQSGAVSQFTLSIGETDYTFTVLKGGVKDGVADMVAFVGENLLTWQPQVKKVKIDDQEFITFYAAEASLVWAKAWFLNNQVITVGSMVGGKCYTIDTTFNRLRSLFLPGYLPQMIDVWIEDRNNVKTWVQRYQLTDDHHEFDDLFLFENSLAGLDTIRFTGLRQERDEHELSSAKFDLETRDYYLEFNRVLNKTTGYFETRAASDWAREFFASVNRWWYQDGKWKRITVLKWEVVRTHNEINAYSFDFALSLQEPLRKIERSELPDPETPAAYDYNEDYNNDYLIKQ